MCTAAPALVVTSAHIVHYMECYACVGYWSEKDVVAKSFRS